MKSKIASLLIFMLIFGVVAGGCSEIVPPEGDLGEDAEFGPVTVVCNGVNITIDPRVELVAVIQYLSDYHINMTSVHFPYRPAVERYFEDFLDHKAVKMFEEMGPKGFVYNLPPTFAVSLTQELEWDENVLLPEDVIENGGGEENLREFAVALKDFSTESDFPKFFASNRDFYVQSIQEIVANIGDHDYVSEIHDYLGIEYNSFTILPVILYRHGAHYALQTSLEAKNNVYSVIPPVRRAGNSQMDYVEEDIFRSWQRHDFSLSFVSPITDMFIDDVMQYEHLFIPLNDQTERMNSATWSSFVKEHIARAITTRLAYAESEEAGDLALANELYQGFIYIEPLLEKLEEYENKREEYPDLISFFPELLTAFDDIS